jgi:predicted amidohydrolase
MEKLSRRSMLAGVSGLAAGPQPASSASPGERAAIKPYLAMVMQPRVIAAKGMAEVHQNLDHVRKLIDQYLKGVWQLSGGGSPKLVVFPESFLHGYGPMKTRTYETNSKLALRIPGEETKALGEKCKQYGFYLAAPLSRRSTNSLTISSIRASSSAPKVK